MNINAAMDGSSQNKKKNVMKINAAMVPRNKMLRSINYPVTITGIY